MREAVLAQTSTGVRPPSDAPSDIESDRRNEARYACDPWVPLIFSVGGLPPLAAGHLVDVSAGGARIKAPSTTQVSVRVGAFLSVTVSYSESTRNLGVEGLELVAEIVAVHWDELELVLHVHFDPRRNAWDDVLDFIARIR